MSVYMHMYYIFSNSFILWLKKDFVDYLLELKSSVAVRDGFTAGEKAIKTLSRETIEGLRLTGVPMCSYIQYNRNSTMQCDSFF